MHRPVLGPFKIRRDIVRANVSLGEERRVKEN